MEQYLRTLSIGAAGVRGKVGVALTLENAGDFGAAFGTLNSGGRILLARDARRSSPMLQRAIASAVAGSGCNIVDGGVMPAGMVHYLTQKLKLNGALLISGGHQEPGWNAIIPIQEDGSYYDDLLCRELFDLYHGRRFIEATSDSIGLSEMLWESAQEEYWKFLGRAVDLEAIRKAKLTVIADFCNGAGAIFPDRFAELFNIKLISINDRVDAELVRNPDVGGNREEPLSKLIQPLKADVGMVFDSDMSRLGLISDLGEALSSELTYPLAASYYIGKHGTKRPLITNCCSSRSLDALAKQSGVMLYKERVGQAAMFQAMRRREGAMCGEGSGSFSFGEMAGFDAFLMAAFILESIAKAGAISEQLKKIERYNMVKMTFASNTSHGYALLRRLKGRLKGGTISETDGLRFDWADGFLSLRLSETEAFIRLISESTDRAIAQDRAWQARIMLENQVAK